MKPKTPLSDEFAEESLYAFLLAFAFMPVVYGDDSILLQIIFLPTMWYPRFASSFWCIIPHALLILGVWLGFRGFIASTERPRPRGVMFTFILSVIFSIAGICGALFIPKLAS